MDQIPRNANSQPHPIRGRATLRPRLVVSVGGHALAGNDPDVAAQMRAAHATFAPMLPLLVGHDVVITHGNGPQVGRLLEAAELVDDSMSLAACVAESEGLIGYLLAQTLMNLFAAAGSRRPVATLLTQVLVAADDAAFGNPVKAIGGTLSPTAASGLRARGIPMRAVAGGFQRLVPSPAPLELLDIDIVHALLDAGAVVIAAGGGGIPVIRTAHGLQGVDAVIDKDLAALALATAIDATTLLIVTDVDAAYTHFNTPQSAPIRQIDAKTLRSLMTAGHFAPGSMLPKVEAAAAFVERGGKQAVICSPRSLPAALAGTGGTTVMARVVKQ